MTLLTKAIGRSRLSSRLLSPTSIYGRRHLTNNGFFRVSEEVREALHSNKPVVALETTIYTHGMFNCIMDMV
jgi:pseudouridine-5'-phosphate glycosidase/pseudouridine kinase